jgi:hypothetical protein
MSSETFSPTAPLPPLECGTLVYRAIRRKWVDDETGELGTIAFLRMPKDTTGLSVSPATTCTVEDCAATLERCYAVVSLHVGKIRTLGLDVIPDFIHHANINTSIPFQNEDPFEAENYATKLLSVSRFAWKRYPVPAAT